MGRGYGIRIRCAKDGRPDDWEARQGKYVQVHDGLHSAQSCAEQYLGTARRTPEVTIDGRDRGSLENEECVKIMLDNNSLFLHILMLF